MTVFKQENREIEIMSIKPVPVFSTMTCIGLVVSIIALIALDGFNVISLSVYSKYIPEQIFEKFPFAENFINPFTISLLLSIPIGLAWGLFFVIVALLYNLFSNTMGGIKFDLRD